MLLMGSCLEGTSFRLPVLPLFSPLEALMASLEPGGDAFIAAPARRDFFLYFSRLVTLMVIQLSSLSPGYPVLFLATHP